MDDKDFDPTQEEAEDRAWIEARKQRWAAKLAPFAAREGLVDLSTLSRGELLEGFYRSIPSSRDARRLVERVEELLGERAERDLWTSPRETALVLKEDGHPGWYLPQRLLYLAEDWQPEILPMSIPEIPERIKRRIERMKGWEEEEAKARAEEQDEVVQALPSGGAPGRLCVYEGGAELELSYGEGGGVKRIHTTMGDDRGQEDPMGSPFRTDPLAMPPQKLPLSLFTRDALRPEGIPLRELATLIAELDLAGRHPGRVWLPVPQPGMVTGTWWRGYRHLKSAEARGELGAEGGFVMIDAWNGSAVVVGPDRDSTFASWRELLQVVQPMPFAGAPPPPEPEEEPPAEETKPPEEPPKDGDRIVISTGVISITIRPPCAIQWPELRPENVAGVLLPLPPLPPPPPRAGRAGLHPGASPL